MIATDVVPTTTTSGQAAAAAARRQETVMGKAIPSQHPAVVLRTNYNLVRALLAIAMIAVVGLTVALVIVANDGDEVARTSSASPAGQINYGGFNPATGRPDSAPLPQRDAQAASGTTRYDRGPEEGSRGVLSADTEAATSAGVRFDGGPEEGTRVPGR